MRDLDLMQARYAWQAVIEATSVEVIGDSGDGVRRVMLVNFSRPVA